MKKKNSGLVSLQLDPLILETASPRTHKPKFVNKVSIIQCFVIIGKKGTILLTLIKWNLPVDYLYFTA